MRIPKWLSGLFKPFSFWKNIRSKRLERQAFIQQIDEKTLLQSNGMLIEEFEAVHSTEFPPSPSITLERIQHAHFEQQTAALCLSGGGIRSAAFALGTIEGFAKRGILKRFHYLSTVSGGGYTGSFLSAWTYRARYGIKDVEQRLNQRTAPENKEETKTDPVRWLRRYTSYLSPRYGVLSPDTWTLGAIYVRNLLLNWFVLLPALGALVCVPFFITCLLLLNWAPLSTALGFLLMVVSLLALRARLCFFQGRNVILGMPLHRVVVVLLFVGAALVSSGHYTASDWHANWFLDEGAAPFIYGPGLVVSLVLFAAVAVKTKAKYDNEALALGLILITIVGGILLAAWLTLFPGLLPGMWNEHFIHERLFVVLATPALVLFLMLPEAIFVGTAAKLGEDHDREWWARVVAFLLGVAVIWVAVGTIVLLGSIALREFWDWASPSITLASVLSAFLALGAFVARRAFLRSFAQEDADVPTGPSLVSRLAHLLLSVVAAIFIAVLLAGIAASLESLFDLVGSRQNGVADASNRTGAIRYTPFDVFLTFIILCGITLWFGTYVEINRFSLHGMYRERLSRAFLAASRWHRPVPGAYNIQPDSLEWRQFQERTEDRFTNFDRHDNPLMQWLSPLRRGGMTLPGATQTPQNVKDPPVDVKEHVRAPLHVLNCALNMVGDRTNTALQERKAASFTLTPLHAGSYETKYRRTELYGGPDGVSLATAMTISGAAVSPNAGHYSTKIMTFMMTLFNARLGWWLGNPSDLRTCILNAPGISTLYLLFELFGLTRGAGKWLFLSDGGHFDNLGLYEMVRRGCRYIVAIDASADPDRTFEDFGNAIRKIRVDFGVEITRREPFLLGGRERGVEGRYAALFDIVYPHLQGTQRTGTLVYIKPSIYRSTPKGAPIDVVEYGSRSASFPHEPTSEQFYLESQFESYRALGEHEVEEILRGFAWSLPEMHESVRAHIKEPFTAAP